MPSDEALIANMPRVARPQRRNHASPPLRRNADGQDHRAFTALDVRKMIEAGVLREKEKLELIDGALIATPSEGDDHVAAKIALTHFFVLHASERANVAIDATLYLDEDLFTEPDVYIWPLDVPVSERRGPDMWLIVEAARTSIRRDLNEKALIYARYGVQEYWVADLGRNELVVHRHPERSGWRSVQRVDAETVVSPLALPKVEFSLQRLRWPLL